MILVVKVGENDKNAVVWFWSYLTGRSQLVYVDGKMSDIKQVPIGVPQGSVLGALLYILYTIDLPEVVHKLDHNCDTHVTPANETNYTKKCKECGNLCCYVDDSNLDAAKKWRERICQVIKLMFRAGDPGSW